MLVDLTHVGDRTGAEIIELSTRPLCCFRAGCEPLPANVRKKTDRQLRAIAEKGGIVGIAAIPLSSNSSRRSMTM
ncbi:membrane dipeptidase [Bradyrhizobium diazoefficiens]|uniref:membrane dipeptidase n=1 Tax=Bradyrhizobium diazoefficiens TaxID=1355477 RepID=UPI003D9BEEDB